jgi:HPt (histidine-containing phosphotransfer) domain-containing protein
MDYEYIKTEYLEMVAGGDPGLLKELVSMFKDQVAEFNHEMKGLFEEKNYKALGNLAHKAKSSVAIMGMDSLANMLRTFELQATEDKNSDMYESYIQRFENDTKCALDELDSLIKNM